MQNPLKDNQSQTDMVSWIKQPLFKPTNRLQSQKSTIDQKTFGCSPLWSRKAYSTSWSYCILKDLKDLGLQAWLPIFIKHFLEDQTFQIWIKNTLFYPNPQEIGVPQGSILSVILFMIKINKIKTSSPRKYVDNFLICYSSKNMAPIERKMHQQDIKMDHEKWFLKSLAIKPKACTSAKSTKCIINPP